MQAATEPLRAADSGSRDTRRSVLPVFPLAAAAFSVGTFAGAALGGPWVGTLAVGVLLTVAAGLRGGRSALLAAVACALLASAGHERFASADRPTPPPVWVGGTHELVGAVRADVVVRGAVARTELDIERVDGEQVDGRVRLRWPAPAEPVRAGDRLLVRGRVAPPDAREADEWRRRGLAGEVSFPERWSVVERDTGSAITVALRALQRRAVANIERSLPEPEAALAAGMLIGERGMLSVDLRSDLRATGTTHLVVVSGQNVALLLGLAVAALSLALSRRRAAVAALVLLPGFVVLVGADPPVVRAAVMAVGIAVADVTGRRTPGWIFLAYAAAIMLAWSPPLARDVAFQLSLAATVGVLSIAPALRDLAARVPRVQRSAIASALVETAALSVGAAIAVFPVQASTFREFSTVQVLANVAVAPLYGGTLVVAAASAALGWFEPAADGFHAAAVWVPSAFVAIVGAFADVPGATRTIAWPSWAGLAWYALLAWVIWRLSRLRGATLNLAPPARLGATVAVGAVAGGLWLSLLAPSDGDASVTVLDVGQGLAVLVQDGGERVLIDTGPPDGSVVVALGRTRGGRSIDMVVVSHDDADHSGGVAEVGRRFRVDAIAGTWPDARPLVAGDRIAVNRRTSIEVLSPPASGTRFAGENDRSLVLRVTIGDQRVLLPADIGGDAERWLTATYGADLAADAIVVPHHGSRSSSTLAFIAAVAPRVAVVSVGANNPYGHPHSDVLARYAGASIYRTDLHGDVQLRSDGRRLSVRPSRIAEAVPTPRATLAPSVRSGAR